jgi:hypothetical protein
MTVDIGKGSESSVYYPEAGYIVRVQWIYAASIASSAKHALLHLLGVSKTISVLIAVVLYLHIHVSLRRYYSISLARFRHRSHGPRLRLQDPWAIWTESRTMDAILIMIPRGGHGNVPFQCIHGNAKESIGLVYRRAHQLSKGPVVMQLCDDTNLGQQHVRLVLMKRCTAIYITPMSAQKTRIIEHIGKHLTHSALLRTDHLRLLRAFF